MNEKKILNEIHRFNDGQKIALLLTIIADVSDGNLHDDEWNLIQSNLVKVKDKKDLKNNPNLVKVIDITSSSTKISNEDIKNNGQEILDFLISSDDFVKVAEWWKNEWYPFFWNEEGGDDTNQMGFFGNEIVPLYRTFFLNQTSLIRRWMHALCVEVFKAEDCGKEQNDIKLGWAQNFPTDIACSMNPIKIKETIKNEDGSIYEGDTISGIWHGQGKYILANGDKYEGDFFEWQLTGKGIFTWADGDKYEGDFINGNRSGKGIFNWASGDKYEGDFLENKRTGKGIYTWTSGKKYEGDFIDGKRSGKGVETLDNGMTYQGSFEDGFRQGQGILTWPNGDKYEGDFNKSKITSGAYTWKDKESFVGDCSIINNLSNTQVFKIKNKPTVSSDYLRDLVLITPMSSDIFKAIEQRKKLGSQVTEIIDVKNMIKDKKLSLEQVSKKKFSSNVFKSLLIESEKIIEACLKNKHLPNQMLSDVFMSEKASFEQKLSIASNESITNNTFFDIINDNSSYLSSRLRKAVALNNSCPEDVTKKLLKDEYRWVREAAASHRNIKNNDISKILTNLKKEPKDRYLLNGLLINPNCSQDNIVILKKLLEDEKQYPREFNEYKIGFDCNTYPSEQCAGTVHYDNMADCIVDYEGSWSDYIWDNDWYNFDDIYHSYGMNCAATHVEYPNHEMADITIEPSHDPDEDDFSIYDYDYMVCETKSYEKGYGWNDWNRYVIELEYELIPESIEPSFDQGICNDYSYQSDNLDGTREEGYFESTDDYSTTGKGTDFDINTDPEDIISEMEENKKDPTNRDEVMEWLQSNYKTE
tara:strand:- start:1408 stop:3849 length:2442 start_codon:yes stop_codon:yes gene_type:complete